MPRQPIPAETIAELAQTAADQWPAFLAEYDRRHDLGYIRNEDYAPLADLASKLWLGWLEANNTTMQSYEQGGAFKIMQATKPLIRGTDAHFTLVTGVKSEEVIAKKYHAENNTWVWAVACDSLDWSSQAHSTAVVPFTIPCDFFRTNEDAREWVNR